MDGHERGGESVEPVTEGRLVDGGELRGQRKEQIGVLRAALRAGLLGERAMGTATSWA